MFWGGCLILSLAAALLVVACIVVGGRNEQGES